MAYTAPTLSAMVDDLARSLGDSGKVFWLQDELERLCREALRTWNCYASYWRNRRQFNTVANNHYYNLSTLNLVSVVADQGPLLNDLQYALVEPFSAVPPFDSFTTTAQYTAAQINSAVLQALKQFQFDAGIVLTAEPAVPLPITPDYQAELNENVADVRHVAAEYIAPGDPLDGAIIHLRRHNEFDIQYFDTTSLMDAGWPYGYSLIFPSSQPTLRIIPQSSMLGELDIVSIRSDSFPPIDWQWPAKWLALHYLLTMDGQSRDHARAQYCKKRYEDALSLAAITPSYAVGYINGRPVPIVPASDMDNDDPGWRMRFLAAGEEPNTLVSYGWNLIGVHPTPSAAAPLFSISFDMFVEAPVSTDPIQIAPEHLQAVLDYAKHIAIFKLGGAEFATTEPLMERFFMEAMEYNSRLKAESRQFHTMRDRANRDKQMYARRAQVTSSENVLAGEGS